MRDSLISVIIPVYNLENYIGDCLESVINNTYKNLEIICVNDGSRDRSLDIIQSYAGRDERIVVIDQLNTGVSGARNAALDRARGDYVGFVDGDDRVGETYFEELLNLLTEYDADMAACRLNKITKSADAGLPREPGAEPAGVSLPSTYTLSDVLGGNYPLGGYTGAKILKRSYVGDVRFSRSLSFNEDKLFHLTLWAKTPGARVVYVPKPLYFYSVRENSLTNLARPGQMLEVARELYHSVDLYREPDVLRLFLTETGKACLSERYRDAFDEREKKTRKESVRLMRTCLRRMRTERCVPAKERLKYTVLCDCPWLYRAFRVRGDKTLLDWEKRQKAASRERRKNGKK